MADAITQLRGDDFEEAVAHLSLVFGDPNFAELVPALYQPTDRHMGRHLAVRSAGRIVAMLGVFPIDWMVGGEHLRLAGIGSVSVHPEHRGRGLMRVLMDAAMEEIAAGGYHAACLGGNRRRYAHWGFEKAGVEASMLITANSLGHSEGRSGERERDGFHVGESGDADQSALSSLYEQLPIRCQRSKESFSSHLRNWRRRAIVARDSDGRVAAYACLDPKEWNCVECCGRTPEAMEAIVRHLVENGGRPLRVSMPLIQDAVLLRLRELADDVSLIEAGNWRIYHWPAVIGALMRASHRARPLVPGSCVLRLRTGPWSDAPKQDVVIRLAVEPDPVCVESNEAPQVVASASEALLLLTSPVPPVVPMSVGTLSCWRPLPLMIPMQDRI